MKKRIIILSIFLIVVIAFITGIIIILNKPSTNDEPKKQSEVVESASSVIDKLKNNITAEEVVNKLKDEVSNIGRVVVYNEETDLNNLLGRPNQYTSKATFEDTRLEQTNLDNEYLSEEERNEPTGGTVEVFENKEDAEARKNYIESLSNSFSFLVQYIYLKDNVLLRVEGDLTPTQAEEYEKAFNKIMN